ncbi:MAG TPA: tetratricopeptide repeat protein [Chloroflexota bacterium]
MVRAATAQRHADTSIGALGTEVGRRIRAARLERGMTLAQLGGEDLSKSFLSLVESGRSRISLRALGIVAQQLELPLSYFLDGLPGSGTEGSELALDRAEAALLRQDASECLRILDGSTIRDAHRARALWLRGWALIVAEKPREAVPVLQEGLALAGSGDDVRLTTQLRYTLGMALYNATNYEESLVYLREALPQAVHEVEDPVLIGKITAAIGHVMYVMGDSDGAIQQYVRARDLFGSLYDLQTLGSVYSGLSLAYEHKSDPDNALRYAKLSLGAYEAWQNAAHAATQLNNLAVLYREKGDLDEALHCASEAVTRAEDIGAREVEALAHSTVAEIHFDLGQYDLAGQEAERAEQLAPSEDHPARIDASLVRAQLAERNGDSGTADRLYQWALETLAATGRNTVFVDAAVAYSLILQRRGDTEGALRFALDAAHAKLQRSG